MGRIKKNVTGDNSAERINPKVLEKFGIGEPNENLQTPYLVLKYLDIDSECFSSWSKQDLSDFGNLVKKMKQMTWGQLRKQGGKNGNKVGLGFTAHKNQPDSNSYDRLGISKDIDNFSELRVNQKARLHGFRVNSAFFAVWLDKDHQYFK